MERASGRARGRAAAVATLGVLALLVVPTTVSTAVTRAIRLRWVPSADRYVGGYRAFVRLPSGEAVREQDLGLPPPESDGTLAGVVDGLDPDVDYVFAVTVYRSDGTESAPSNSLALPSICRHAAAELQVHHVAIGSRHAKRHLMVRTSFRADDVSDLRASDVDLTLRGADGALLYRAVVPGSALRSGSRHRVLRYRGRRGARAPDARGLRALVVRRHGSLIAVRLRAVVPELRHETPRPLGLAVRIGQECATAQLGCGRGRHHARCQ